MSLRSAIGASVVLACVVVLLVGLSRGPGADQTATGGNSSAAREEVAVRGLISGNGVEVAVRGLISGNGVVPA